MNFTSNYFLCAGIVLLLSNFCLHTPQHVWKEFPAIKQYLSELHQSLGSHFIFFLLALSSLFIVFMVAGFYAYKAIETDLEEIDEARLRRRYARVLFLRLLKRTREYERKMGTESELSRLDAVCAEFREQMEEFRSGAERLLTPSADAFFADPREYYAIEEEGAARVRVTIKDESIYRMIHPI